MAETVAPSVRGRKRFTINLTLTMAAASSAALVGWLAGVLGAALGRLPAGFSLPIDPFPVAVLAAGAVGLDGLVLALGRPRPVTLGRQVPREWGRLLAPHPVAMLYGARLGVGPLTILSTWMWWAFTVAAALIGVGTSVAIAVWFAVARMMVSALVSARLSRPKGDDPTDGVVWFNRLRAAQRPGWLALTGLGAALALAGLTLPACGEEAPGRTLSHLPAPVGESVEDAPGPDPTPTHHPTLRAARSVPDTDPVADPGSHPPSDLAAVEPAAVAVTIPAPLEDFVRTSTPTGSPTSQPTPRDAETPVGPQSADPQALSAALPARLLDLDPVDDPQADRHLTLAEAAAIQPDPMQEQALLETRGFQGGWVRAFHTADNDVAVTSVYQFADAAQAEFYLEDGLITIGGQGGEFFHIPQLPGIRGFHQPFVDGSQPTAILGGAFHHGARWYLLYLVGSPDSVDPETLVTALTELRRSSAS